MEITTEQVKALRDETGVSVMQCRKALEEAGGDMDKARAVLKDKSAGTAEKLGGRTLGAGNVASYVHTTGNVGTLVLLSCETDFVAKNDEFKALGYDIAMHVSAMSPETNEELLDQPFVKDPSLTVKALIEKFVQKFGERIELTKFVRLSSK